jgi:anaerobic selenocysteine-containing dehydrogenase
MADNLTRRDFLSYSGAAVAGITLGEFGRRRLARADALAETWHGRGVERFASSVCRECPAGCGVRVRLIDEVPVKVDGNPNCPVARGRLCPKGQASIEAFFDPDRLIGPAKRTGKRGEQHWEPISWPAAVAMLAARLAEAREGDGMLAIAAEERGPLADAWSRFWTSAGARVAWTLPPTAARLRARLEALTGTDADPVFDLAHASYVLSFGAPLVEDWLSPVWAQRSYGEFRRGRAHSRGRLVQVDYRRSLTAKKADEWLAVSVDAQIFLAYGLMSVLLREDRVNREFLDELGGNLAGFDREIVSRYTPDNVSAATGVPVVTILRLARELTATPQPLVVVAGDADSNLVDAVLALNALIGTFDRGGGISASTTYGPAAAAATVEDATAVLQEIAAGHFRPRLLALRDSSALRSLKTPPHFSGLDAATFVVSFSPYLDESAAIADLLLPAHTSFESWHALTLPAAVGGEVIALTPPAVHPRLDTCDVAGTLRKVAVAAGGDLASAFAWESSEELVRAEAARLYGAGRGGPFSSMFETEWVGQLEKGGWWVPAAKSTSEFVGLVLDAGGWTDPFAEPSQIRAALAHRGGLSFVSPMALPSLAAPNGTAAQAAKPPSVRPLLLVAFTPAVISLTGTVNQPGLFELLGQPESAPWHVWAELATETAAQYGIRHGARIRISSVSGSVEAIAIVVSGMPPNTVALAFVPTVPRGGRWVRMFDTDARALWGANEPGKPCPVHIAVA